MMKSIVIVIITTTIYSSTETNLIFPEALLKVRVNMHYSCLDISGWWGGWIREGGGCQQSHGSLSSFLDDCFSICKQKPLL